MPVCIGHMFSELFNFAVEIIAKPIKVVGYCAIASLVHHLRQCYAVYAGFLGEFNQPS